MIPNIDKFSELEHNSILLGCRYLYASDQTAGVPADLDPPRFGPPGPNPLADTDPPVQIR